MKIKLSVICPIYKVEQYIPELIESLVKGLNCCDVEIIFVNDCSPDNSINLCEDLLKKNKDKILFHYKIINHLTNGGLSAARNTALNIAQGDYISFIDSDDLISENYWNFLSEKINSYDDIIEFEYKEFTHQPPTLTSPHPRELDSNQLNPYKTGFFVWKRIYKRELIKNTLFPIGLLYEDIYFVTETFSKARKTSKYSNILIYYRQRHGSITNHRDEKFHHQLENLIRSAEKNIHGFSEKSKLSKLLTRKSLIILLKGLRISDRKQRKIFFKKCAPLIDDIYNFQKLHGYHHLGKGYAFINLALQRFFQHIL